MAGLSLSVSRSARLSVPGRVLTGAAAMLLFAGLAGCVVALTGVQLPGPAVAAGLVAALVAAVVGCLVAGRGRVELAAYASMAALVVVAAVIMGLAGGGLLQGGAQFANALLVRIGEHTQEYALPYRTGGDVSLAAFCALAGLAGGAACSLFAQRGVVVPALVLAAAALAGVVSGWAPVGWWAPALALGVLACLGARSMLSNDRAARSSLAWALAFILAGCLVVGGAVGVAVRGPFVDTSEPAGAIDRLLWGLEYGEASFAMPDGQLDDLGALKASDQIAMDVTVDAPTSEYLRGFVGGAYEGDAWAPTGSDAVMGNRSLLYWLAEDGLVGASQIATAADLAEYGERSTVAFGQVLHAARKPYAYLPYGYVGGAAAHPTTDLSQMRVGGSDAAGVGAGGADSAAGAAGAAGEAGAAGAADANGAGEAGLGIQGASFDPFLTRQAYLVQDAVDKAQKDADFGRLNGGAADIGGTGGAAGAAGADTADGADAADAASARARLLRTYLDDNAAYRDFAVEQYAAVPDDVAQLFGQLYGPPVQLTTEQAKIQVLALLDDTVAYSDDPRALDEEAGADTAADDPAGAADAGAGQEGLQGTAPGQAASQTADEADFLTRFLTVTRSGYSVHYATAATLLMRYYGVPARYVEGYVLNTDQLDAAALEGGEDAEGADGDSEGADAETAATGDAGAGEVDADADAVAGDAPFLGTYALTERQAHAWVEYYLDGVGWVPFDVTPGWRNAGYYDTTPDAQLVDESQNWSVGEADQDTVWTPPKPEQEEAEENPDAETPVFAEMVFDFLKWPWVLVGILFSLYIAFLVRNMILRTRLSRFLAQTGDESVPPAEVVPMLFSFLVMLVQKCGGVSLENLPYAAQGALVEDAGLCPADLFEIAAHANDRALFAADPSQVSREDALAVFACVKAVASSLTRQLSPWRRFWQRSVLCLW